jgi:ribosome-binding factor A
MSRRMYRVNEAIKEVVSQEIETHVSDPRIGFVTVTGVETTPDLRHAKVFVSVMGDAEHRKANLEALDAAHGYIQARLADRLVLKRTPKLQFVYDETIDKGLHINELIDLEAAAIAERKERSSGGEQADPHTTAGGEPPAPGGEGPE